MTNDKLQPAVVTIRFKQKNIESQDQNQRYVFFSQDPSYLDLSKWNITAGEAEDIGHLLQKKKDEITNLDMDGNTIGPKLVKTIQTYLNENTTLEQLSLRNNEGLRIIDIVHYFNKSTNLKKVYLDENYLTKETAKKIGRLLEELPLSMLSLQNMKHRPNEITKQNKINKRITFSGKNDPCLWMVVTFQNIISSSISKWFKCSSDFKIYFFSRD
jgi:hypothetical protein